MSPVASSVPVFETRDLNLASFLLACGHPLTGTSKDGDRTVFQFLKRNASGLLNDYFDNALIPVQSFVQAQQKIRIIIHSSKVRNARH